MRRPSSGTCRRLLAVATTVAVALPLALATTGAGASVSAAPVAAADVSPYPAGQTYKLHSRPTSDLTIFLDADGADVSGTVWNTDHGLPDGFYPAYDSDNDTTIQRVPEKVEIQRIWQRVAEDFAPFDVDVTTEDPGAAALERTDLSDTEYGARVLITRASDATREHLCEYCEGISVQGSFGTVGSGVDPAAWAITSSSVTAANAASHELGHTLGLHDDGTTVPTGGCYELALYCGHGWWAPIMGRTYRAVTQWSRGEYPNANNTEDDLALIAARIPLVPDEAGGDVATAAAALPSGPAVIATAADTDTYRVGTCSGPVRLAATTAFPAALSGTADLDIQLELLDAAGSVVLTANPPNTSPRPVLDAAIETTLTPGTWYVRVDGVGAMDPGYSDYASVGAYALTKTGCDAATAPGRPTVTGTIPGADTMSVTFVPTGDGGSPITEYTTQCTSLDGGAKGKATSTGSPVTVPGLMTGSTYHCRVRAANAVGKSQWSKYGAVVLAGATAPSAPTVASSTGVGAGVEVAAAPTGDGGAPISGYAAECVSDDGGPTGTVTDSDATLVVVDLGVGHDYRCRVRAANAVGASAWSDYGTVVPVRAGVPQPVVITSVVQAPGRAAVDVHFTPNGNGGSMIISYQARCGAEGSAPTRGDWSTTSPIRLSASYGYRYVCQARGQNQYGWGRWSRFSDPVPVVAP